jgi:hypothetical protein
MIDVAVEYNEDRTVDGWIDGGMDVFFGVEHRLQIDGVLIIYIPLYSD